MRRSREPDDGRRTQPDPDRHDVDPADRAVVARFDRARRRGALERTSVSLAAWAWLDHHGGETLIQAEQAVRRILRRHGRRVAP